MESREFIRTGEAAALLGCSRQHVVDLCNDGLLPAQSTGVHRRLLRSEVNTYLASRETAPRREVLASLWLNRAIAGKLVKDPDRVLKIGRKNIKKFRVLHAGSSMLSWLDKWERILDQGAEAVLRVLTSESESARALRQTSPFPGVLSEGERRQVANAFERYWTSRRP